MPTAHSVTSVTASMPMRLSTAPRAFGGGGGGAEGFVGSPVGRGCLQLGQYSVLSAQKLPQ